MDVPGAPPTHLGRYELLARLASGGMGEIFLARLEGAAGFEKLFVIKRILPHLAGDVRFRAMLIGEARIASMMTHANVCQVYELGETDGQLYIVMEYLEGSTMLPLLRKLSKHNMALDLGFIAGVIQQATDGLHYAHELKERSGEYLGIVHRDVTPSNIFLTDAGVVKVLDFGIAKVKNASAQTQTGMVKGKYAYMAPEQLRGSLIDRRADVFALGVILYEMLALRRLFQRKTDYLTFRAVMEQPIMDIRHYRPDCPDALATTLRCALDRDPANRFETARQFGSAVLDAIGPLRRPWTQGELSDFVSAQFTEEIRLRSAQIASAVQPGSRQEMLQLAPSDEDGLELEDQAPEFPPVDSEISETPVDIRHLRGPSDEHTAVNDPVATQPPLLDLRAVPTQAPQPGPGSQQQPVMVLQPRRSVLWPLVACAMVLVSGGALLLVWRQTQNPPPAPNLYFTGNTGVAGSGSGVVIVGPNVTPTAPGDPGSASDPGSATDAGSASAPGSDSGSEPAGTAEPARPAPPAAGRKAPSPPSQARKADASKQKFREVVNKQRSAVNRCIVEHGHPPPGTVVDIAIGPDGHPIRVVLQPDEADGTPLGACIKAVFKAAVFPYDPNDDNNNQFTVNLVRPA
jgi:eukaryotic-like serine/threonine-protein kinase